jgi:hypothetical protein
MPKPFIPLTRAQFLSAVSSYSWSPAKSEIHVHHTWRPNHSQYRGLASIEGMWRYHTVENKWSDIAQHVSIGPEGTIWTGRTWSRTPASAIGYSHRGVFMIETIGDFDNGKDVLDGEQFDSLLSVVAILQIYFQLPLWSSIKFHNEMSGKSCPGESVDRTQFIFAVREKRAELEAGAFDFAVATRSGTAAAAKVSSVFEADPVSVDQSDGDVEIEHGKALEDAFADPPAMAPAAGVRSIDEPDGPAAQVRGVLAEAGKQEDELTALYVELGRLQTMNGRAAMAPGEAVVLPSGMTNHFAKLGRILFRRISRELHMLICGTDPQDKEERDRLRAAFSLGNDAITAALVAVMTTGLGITGGIAVVVAAIVLKRILAPTLEETCQYFGALLAE